MYTGIKDESEPIERTLNLSSTSRRSDIMTTKTLNITMKNSTFVVMKIKKIVVNDYLTLTIAKGIYKGK